jgi:long-chain acyl-CoA synthetase
MNVSGSADWLGLYDEGLEGEMALEYDSALGMFSAAVERAGERALIHYFDTAISAGRVDELSSSLAVGLGELGVGRGDRVALYLQNVPQFVIGLVAAWKLGAIVVSCNPMLRQRELTGQLRDCGAVGLITLESLHREIVVPSLPDLDLEFVVTTSELDLLDQDPPEILAGVERDRASETHDLVELTEAHVGAEPPEIDLAPDDVALLTYTSGTTGPPKGAMNTHRNFVHSSQVFRDWFHTGDDDVVLGIAPLFHITGLLAHIGIAFSVPIPMVLAYRFDSTETIRLIEKHRATITVAAITAYLAMQGDEALDRHDISSLQKAYSGGAPIPPATVNGFRDRTGIAIRSAYGLTETTSPSHLCPLGKEPPTDEDSGALAVGVPVFNTDSRIIDDDGRSLAAGEVGEVAISGPQVVPGYWNKPEETENAIREGELRTGDVGKVDEEGWLYIVDRKKDQINAAGYKIWPREVEDVLYQHAAVYEAAVVGAPDEYRGETVHAYVSITPGESVEPEELVAFCREEMAAYKVPRAVHILDEIPKTTSGKILRRELRGLRI